VKARERRAGEIPLKAIVERLERAESPREQPAQRELILRRLREGRSQGSKPRSRGAAALDPRFGERVDPQANGRWVQCSRKRRTTLQAEKAPKGESHERRRRETKPAGQRKGENRQEGNQTLKAERSGQAKPAIVDLRGLMCCREQKPMRGAAVALATRLGFA
jgi:hypothetical protein